MSIFRVFKSKRHWKKVIINIAFGENTHICDSWCSARRFIPSPQFLVTIKAFRLTLFIVYICVSCVCGDVRIRVCFLIGVCVCVRACVLCVLCVSERTQSKFWDIDFSQCGSLLLWPLQFAIDPIYAWEFRNMALWLVVVVCKYKMPICEWHFSSISCNISWKGNVICLNGISGEIAQLRKP